MFNGRLADRSAGAQIVYDCAYYTLMVRRIYKIYEADPWIVRCWIIGVLFAGTQVSRILGPYRYVMITSTVTSTVCCGSVIWLCDGDQSTWNCPYG